MHPLIHSSTRPPTHPPTPTDEHIRTVPRRYVPPGALPGRPQIMQKGPLDAKFTFFGFIGLGRKGCWRYLRQTSPLLASKLEKVYTIW